MPKLRIKRIYDVPEPADGTRILVDRLWPRGMSKERAELDLWLPQVAPSHPLRRWFAHDPERWAEFRQRYGRELDEADSEVAEILAAARAGTVTLLFSARDPEHNQARALGQYLAKKEPGLELESA